MSKTKFLGIPEGGKRAGWIEMEGGSSAGVGGNDREFIVELTQDYHGQFSGNKTYEEMLAAAQEGKYLVAYMTTPDGYVCKSVGFQVANDGDATIIAFLILGASLDMPLTIGCAPDNNWSRVTT